MSFFIWHAQNWSVLLIFHLRQHQTKNTILIPVPKSRLRVRVSTWEASEGSADCFFLLSWTQKYEYKPMPRIATSIPMMFLVVKGSCSKVYPKARTRQVLRCPSTWYVTGEVLPMTMNVLKFTDTDMMHERIMNACMEMNYAPHEIVIFAPKMFIYIDR